MPLKNDTPAGTAVAIYPNLWETTSTNGLREVMIMAKRPRCPLVGEDGNIFAILGRVRKVLRESGHPEQADEVIERVTNAASYDEALQIIAEYINVE